VTVVVVVTDVEVVDETEAFFTKDVKVVEFKSNEPGTQNLQRSVVPVGASTATQG
jgi:hypothetical protein